MGYLIALSIGLTLGWPKAALLMSGSRVKPGSLETGYTRAGICPICEDSQVMGNT